MRFQNIGRWQRLSAHAHRERRRLLLLALAPCLFVLFWLMVNYSVKDGVSQTIHHPVLSRSKPNRTRDGPDISIPSQSIAVPNVPVIPSFVNAKKTSSPGGKLKIDVITTTSRSKFLDDPKSIISGQVSQFESDPNVRWVLVAGEEDFNSNCTKNEELVTPEQRRQICHTDIAVERGIFPEKWDWAKCFTDRTAGWWCAQSRAAFAMVKMFETYNQGDELLCDWLAILDDDTYINLKELSKSLSRNYKARALALTPVVWRVPSGGATHYGGGGLFINRKAVRILASPLSCSQTNPDIICAKVANNKFFREGMNLAEWMQAMLTEHPLCLHSDWWQGWLLTYIAQISLVHLECDIDLDSDNDTCRVPSFNELDKGICRPEHLVCHRMNPEKANRLQR